MIFGTFNDTTLCVFALSYLLGSVPFGLLLTRRAGLGDIRKIGSGNIGATNVLRTGNKKLALLTLLLDGGKGALAVVLVAHFAPEQRCLAGLAALLGHIYPVWLRFRGGKGVATSLGVMLGAAWPVGLMAIGIWIGVVALSRYSSVGALAAVALLPLLAYALDYSDTLWLCLAIAALVYLKHAHNIQRLFNHTEPKIGQSRQPTEPLA